MANKIAVVAAILLFAFPAFCAVKVGDPAPEINLQSLIPDQPASNATLKALKGKAVVIEFWATWCAPCVEAIPHLNELAKQFADRPIQFISITYEDKEVVEAFIKKRPIAGWIGFDPGKKLIKTYGFEGIPQTVLIDAKGNYAGVTYPHWLKAEHLKDLMAGKKLTLPNPTLPDITIKRESLEKGAEAMLDILVRPSASGSPTGMMAGNGKYIWKGSDMKQLFAAAHSIPYAFVEGNAFTDTSRYDVSITGPKSESAEIMKMLPNLFAVAFHVTATLETREVDGWIITAPNGRPEALKEAAGMGGFSQAGNGALKLTGTNMEGMAGMMQTIIKKPVADKTGIQGRFDLNIQYEEAKPESLLDALRKIGFVIEPAKVPTQFLVVNKK